MSAISKTVSALLITGGSGFLGSSVLKMLATNPWPGSIYVASRLGNMNLPQGQESCTLDLEDKCLCIPEGVDTVVHIAGEKSDVFRMNDVNHLGTQRLARAACDANVKRFVYVSSVGSYGAAPCSGRVDESYPHTPRNQYERSKNDGEMAVRQMGEQSGMTVVVMQPSNVIGLSASSGNLPLLGLMRMIVKGWFLWLGDAETWVNYVAVDDVAAAVVKAACDAPSDTFIINTPAKLVDVVGWVCEELGCSVPHHRLPLALGRAAAAAGSAIQDFTQRSFPLNRERLLEMTNTNRYDPSHFMNTLQFDYPMGVQQLIRSLARTYRQRGLL